jgi:hypothetical protein
VPVQPTVALGDVLAASLVDDPVLRAPVADPDRS